MGDDDGFREYTAWREATDRYDELIQRLIRREVKLDEVLVHCDLLKLRLDEFTAAAGIRAGG